MENSTRPMKPFFCIDVTADKHNEAINGIEFITRTASEQKVQEYEAKQEGLDQTMKKSKLPLWMRVVSYLCGLYFMMVVAATIRAGFEKAMQNAPWMLMSAAVCGVVWGILLLAAKIKASKVLKQEGADQQSRDIDKDFGQLQQELEVPKDALDVDVMVFKYKLKKGEICPRAFGLQTTPYINASVKMYATQDELYIVDLDSVYTLEKYELRRITTVNKRISVSGWNKEEDPRQGSFKPYKITLNNVGDIFFKPYYILEIERDFVRYGIYFPCYELEVMERLTGLKADK